MTASAAGILTPRGTLIDGPYFEDLHQGQQFEDVPSLTLAEGLAVTRQAIVGGRLPLALANWPDTPAADVLDWRFVALLAWR